jgi:hypothetical protein
MLLWMFSIVLLHRAGDAFAQGSFEAIHDSQHEDGGVARSPNEQKKLVASPYNNTRTSRHKELVDNLVR